MSETFDKVKKIVIERLGVEADKVALESSFISDLGADSLDTVELVMAFEDEFNIEIGEQKVFLFGDNRIGCSIICSWANKDNLISDIRLSNFW